MVSFASDYLAGTHPKVLEKLVETNLEILPGYGTDHYCADAAEKIRQACACPEAEVFFLSGGTQTNQTIISTMLPDYAGVIAAATGHVSVHEAGAIEHAGHKVLALPSREGKLAAADVRAFAEDFYADESYEHMVFPGMVYISHPTEYGTLYSKSELEELVAVCRAFDLPLFIDGARLAYALASRETDVSLADIAALADVFYIGGTKCGALCGEAVVFTNKNTPPRFITQIKQRGALLAKGRLLGAQFDALFTEGLYLEIGRWGIAMSEKLKEILREAGLDFHLETPTNQQFVILDNARIDELRKKVGFEFWEKYDADHTVVRFATSWSTTDADLEELKKGLEISRLP